MSSHRVQHCSFGKHNSEPLTEAKTGIPREQHEKPSLHLASRKRHPGESVSRWGPCCGGLRLPGVPSGPAVRTKPLLPEPGPWSWGWPTGAPWDT